MPLIRPSGICRNMTDLKKLFKSKIDKEYPEDLYEKQFSLYIDNIIGRIDLQVEAYGKEPNIPSKTVRHFEKAAAGARGPKR